MAKGKKYKVPANKKNQKKPLEKKVAPTPKVAKVAATASKNVGTPNATFIFGKTNYIYMLAGGAFLALGLILMSGGKMPSPDVWDDSIIYSFRRITLAPILMIIGLVLEILAIFKR